MNNILITGAENYELHFLERWLPHGRFLWGARQHLSHINDDSQLIIPEVTHPNYVHALLSICLDNGINQVYPTGKTEQVLLNEALLLFSEFDIQIYCPSASNHQLLENPAEVLKRLQEGSVGAVPYVLAGDFNQFSSACVRLGYPSHAISFTNLDGKHPVYIIGKQDDLKAGEFAMIFTQAAQLLNKDLCPMLLVRKLSGISLRHLAFFYRGELKSSWLDLSESEKQILESIGTVSQLSGIYHIQLQENLSVYQITSLIGNDIF